MSRQFNAWKPGQKIPHELLFPNPLAKPIDPGLCEFYACFDSATQLIREVENDALLEAVVYEPRASGQSFTAAVTRLVERKGLVWLSNRLKQQTSTRWEQDAFRQMLQSRFLKISIAFIQSGDMPAEDATRALEELRAALDKGAPWRKAYLEVSDRYPDTERRKLIPNSVSTLISYLYDGWISEFGFDFSQLRMAAYFPAEHLHLVCVLKKGGTLVSSPSGEYLFYVFEVYEPDA